jgi:hypothetical protein
VRTVCVKVAGTAGVVALLLFPGRGILDEVAGQPFVVAGFFGLVALYCAALQRTLTLTGGARPASVWWMFAVPYNFVEDFFIVRTVAAALAADGRAAAPGRWSAVGYAWCTLQILSLLPGMPGYAAGAAALPVWAAHWIMTARINRSIGH